MQSALDLQVEKAEASPLPAEAERPRTGVRHRLALAIVVVLGVGVPFVVALATGSLSIPHNDSWSYGKIAQIFAETGRIHLLNWNRTALIGQVILLGPLARWIWVQQAAAAVLAVIALLATYRVLARRLTPGRAVFGTALVAAFPGFGLLATSFMEDVPAFLAAVACLALADLAFERRSSTLLAVALVVGMFGTMIREEDLAAPAAVVIAALVAWGRRKARTVVSMAIVLVVVTAVFEVWRDTLPYGDRPALTLTLHAGAIAVARGYLTLALLVCPVVFVSGVIRNLSRLGAVLAVPAALLGVASVAFLRGSVFLGDYLQSNGSYAAAYAGVRIVIPSAVMDILTAAALISGSLLPAVVVARWRDLDPLLRGVAILTTLGTIAECFLRQPVFDRDLLLLLVPATVLCLRAPAWTPRPYLRAVPLVCLAAVSLLLCFNALARDAAVWAAANRLVARGTPATSIDAGLDWVGYHATTPAHHRSWKHPPERDFWDRMFPRSKICYVVRLDSLRGRVPVERVEYRTYAVFGSSQINVYRLRSCPRQLLP